MTSERRFKDKRTVKGACDELMRCSKTQFDPELVKLFIDNIDQIL